MRCECDKGMPHNNNKPNTNHPVIRKRAITTYAPRTKHTARTAHSSQAYQPPGNQQNNHSLVNQKKINDTPPNTHDNPTTFRPIRRIVYSHATTKYTQTDNKNKCSRDSDAKCETCFVSVVLLLNESLFCCVISCSMCCVQCCVFV